MITKAEEMFNELGYKLYKTESRVGEPCYRMKFGRGYNVLIYFKKIGGFLIKQQPNFSEIKKGKLENYELYPLPKFIELDLLKAINQQCLELGWIE